MPEHAGHNCHHLYHLPEHPKHHLLQRLSLLLPLLMEQLVRLADWGLGWALLAGQASLAEPPSTTNAQHWRD